MATTGELPNQMKAAAIHEFGPPEVVHVETVPVPKLAKNEILVRVAIAGVGPWDPDLISGAFVDTKARFPRVFGSDGAGTVVATGEDVRSLSVGDRVYGWGLGNPKGGFFAEYTAIKEKDAARIPDTIGFEEAGALAVAGITALQGLEELDLEAGQRAIIFGASGGVGHVAVQLAKRLELEVFAVASHADGVALALRCGADVAIEGHDPTLVERARWFAPDDFDGALVFAGGDGWKAALELVDKGATIAWPNGVEPTPAVPRGRKRKAYDGVDSAKAFARLNDLVGRGPFHIELSKVYSLDEVPRALHDVRQHHLGKLALKIG